eukprot:462448-Rhodomonas_salina.2
MLPGGWSGIRISYGLCDPIGLRACYAGPGTDVAYGAIRVVCACCYDPTLVLRAMQYTVDSTGKLTGGNVRCGIIINDSDVEELANYLEQHQGGPGKFSDVYPLPQR